MSSIQRSLRYGVSLAALIGTALLSVSTAQAGGFGIREQSTYYQGMSFAGEAAGNDLSSMFWNPAAAAAVNGFNSSSNVTVIAVDTDMHTEGGILANFMDHSSGSISDPGVVPASYYNYQVNDRLFLGLAINSPFSFATKPDNIDWAGSPFATTSKVFSLNLNPTIAYKLTPTLTVGAGLQVEYFDVTLKSGPNPLAGGLMPGRTVEGDDWGIGATAGLIWQPTTGTQIGLGYRSAVDITLDGTCKGYGLSNTLVPGGSCLNNPNIKADLTLPDIVSLGLRQSLTRDLTFMGTVEWTRWSSLGTVMINSDASGAPVDAFPLNYEDGWFFSGGLEYTYDPNNTFRFGIGWEKSPITDQERRVSLPDADRLWLSVGASHKLTERASIDLAYTHIMVDDASICETEATNCGYLKAESESKVNIVSAAFKYKWGGATQELEPLK
jgi:long-chain fatty acid transport protein